MEIPKEIKNEIWDYCRVNNITNIDDFILKCLKQGFSVEKYGATPVERTVEKIVEVIKEIPVEKRVEVPIAMIDTDLSDNLKNYIALYEQSQIELRKACDQSALLQKQLDEEKAKNKRDLYGEN